MSRAKDKTKDKARSSAKKSRTEDAAVTTKKAFDLPRDSVYAADPIAELRICGAKGVVPADEAGDLDTPPGPDIPVKDLRRLRKALNPLFKENVDKRKSHTPIVIAKIDDVATVLEGKRRVRAARASNRKRMKDGRPLIKIRCVMQRDVTPLAIMATVISGNNAREDDVLSDKIEKLLAFLEMGASEEDAAVEFNVGVDRIRDWLDYNDRATDRVKAAVDDGKIPASTGLELAKIKDVDKQHATLDKLLAGTGVRDRSARAARALAQGANNRPTATDRKSQRLLLAYLQKPGSDLGRTRTSTDEEFWRGVVEALKVVTGQEAADPRVTRALAEARSSTPTPAAGSTPSSKTRSAEARPAEAGISAE
jgi:hypothetical protein